MTAAQFRLLRLHDTRIKPLNQWALHEIFVKGRPQRALAAELGINRSAMSQLVRNAWQRYLELPGNATRLTTLTITIPAQYERALHAWVRDAHRLAMSAVPNDEVAEAGEGAATVSADRECADNR
ncbi:TrfB-related DNA-binding protein [Burkholderia sp. IMCC1007]|uniref:TrfB-related DNA-binding protein n=1 Tax=Burkholderia sp. IMCC1007 TaxID=3004104 RepID=UPI0022B59B78|nr:TrfB-related DNA-binding protein [Burkholderia sp. IMCC1007]